MAHRRARDLLAAMTAFAGTDDFVEAQCTCSFKMSEFVESNPDSLNI